MARRTTLGDTLQVRGNVDLQKAKAAKVLAGENVQFELRAMRPVRPGYSASSCIVCLICIVCLVCAVQPELGIKIKALEE